MLAILARRVARIRTNSVRIQLEFSLSDKSRQSGMVQPVVNEMFATVHAARRRFVSSRFIHFMYNLRFDSQGQGVTVTDGDVARVLR
eukprot:scaffold13700_cov136-Isochrysis_galbana.AAC.7